MSEIQTYPLRAFSPTQKFLVFDAANGSTSLVLGSSLVDYITPGLSYVFSETTRAAAAAKDYSVGRLIQTAGGDMIGDGGNGLYLIVAEGEGDYPMLNGNELLLLPFGDLDGSSLDGALVTDDGVQVPIDDAIALRSVTYPSMEALRLSETSHDYVDTAAYYDDGTTGAAKLKRNGTGTPTGPGADVIASALVAGTFFNAGGHGYRLRSDVAWTPYFFGAVGDGVADDYAPIQRWLDAGGGFAGPGKFRNDTAPWVVPDRVNIFGFGRHLTRGTTFVSGLVGESLFKTTAGSVAFWTMSDARLEGNGVSGAGGSGHAINLIDPVSGGTWSPQLATFERLHITGFLGSDDADRAGIKKISAAGVMMYQPLGIACRDVHVFSCGHAFYVQETQNCRIQDCVSDGITKYALFAFRNVNLVVEGCDFVDAGDGTADVDYPEAGLGSGIIGSFRNKGCVYRNNKVKDMVAGDAVIYCRFDYSSVWDSNWIRGSASTDSVHKAMYAYRCPGIKIINNTFSPANTGFAQDYENIELYNDQTSEAFQAKISGNKFEDVSGQDIAYNIKIGGNSSSRAFMVDITDNTFGELLTLSAASVVAADIVLENCAIRNSVIGGNLHYAATNCTRTVGVTASSITNAENRILSSTFLANGGTITAEYSGIFESTLFATLSYNPANLTAGSSTSVQTVAVTGARVGQHCSAVFSLSLQGMDIVSWVSANDEVSFYIRNVTAGTLDIGDGTMKIMVLTLQ